MIALAIAATLFAQDMTQAEMIDEAEQIGRAGYAMGVCSRHYDVQPEIMQRWTDDFRERAAAAGWSESVMVAALQSGVRKAGSALDLSVPTIEVGEPAFRAGVAAMFDRIKASCHRFQTEHSGLITDMDQGDRNADADLAITLRPLDE